MVTKKLFFAYASKKQMNDENINAIKRFRKNNNSNHNKSFEVLLWEDIDKTGCILNKTILSEIDKCELFACDISTLNQNVLFELGYAIGKRNKIIHVFFNSKLKNANEILSKSILSDIKYKDFTKEKHISDYFKKNKQQNIEFFKDFTNSGTAKKDFLYINSSISTQSSDLLTECFKEKEYSNGIVIDRPEIGYQTLSYYVQQILQIKKAILIHSISNNYENSEIEKADNSFIAGLSFGLGLKVAILSDEKQKAPLDYRELVISYSNDNDCFDKADEWLKNNINKTVDEKIKEEALKEEIKKQDNSNIIIKHEDRNLNILKLGLYYYLAEQEIKDLPNYFISTTSYEKALNNKYSLILFGRKGVGKSAIYYKLIDDLSTNSKNLIVNLYPDPEDMSRDISFIETYSTSISRRSFFLLMWKYIVYSKLAIEIYEKDVYKNNTDYSYVEKNKEIMKYSFSALVYHFNKISRINEEDIPLDTKLLEIIQEQHISPLLKIIKKYIGTDRYYKIYILADNLDKFWRKEDNLNVQADMISALFEIRTKILHELQSLKQNIFVSTLIFLRKDIYNFIVKKSTEQDKITINSEEIQWDDYPEKISNLIEARLKYALEMDEPSSQNISTKEILEKYFKFKQNKDPIDYVKQIVVARPRDIIFFFSKMFESAANRNREDVRDIDFEYAKKHYLKFFRSNLIDELITTFDNIEKIIDYIISSDKEGIEYSALKKYLKHKKYSQKQINNLLEIFSKYDFIYITERNSNKHININTFLELKDEKFLYILPKHKYMIYPKKWQ